MIRLTDDRRAVGGVALGAIWISDGSALRMHEINDADIGGLLCVAQDMIPWIGWHQGKEAMHVGLVDGPGNEPAAYIGAVLALHALLRRHNTLVYCHSRTRSLAVVMMYARMGRECGWDRLLDLLREKADVDFLEPHAEHRRAYEGIRWDEVATLARGKL